MGRLSSVPVYRNLRFTVAGVFLMLFLSPHPPLGYAQQPQDNASSRYFQYHKNPFNPANRYDPANPWLKQNRFLPNSPLNPANRYDFRNPLNPANKYQPDNPLNPLNRYDADNPLNPAGRYNPYLPVLPKSY